MLMLKKECSLMCHCHAAYEVKGNINFSLDAADYGLA